jgi:hypothetical protein
MTCENAKKTILLKKLETERSKKKNCLQLLSYVNEPFSLLNTVLTGAFFQIYVFFKSYKVTVCYIRIGQK